MTQMLLCSCYSVSLEPFASYKNKKRRVTSPLLHPMVPKGGFEPPRGLPTTPSRWRVYQFHHFGNRADIKKGYSVLPLCRIAVLEFKRQHFFTVSARGPGAELERRGFPQEPLQPVSPLSTRMPVLWRQKPGEAM